MRAFFSIIILSFLVSGCAATRDVGSIVQAFTGAIPQKISDVGSASRGAYLARTYPSGEFAIIRDKKVVRLDGFSTLDVVLDHTDGSYDFVVLSGKTLDGVQKSVLFTGAPRMDDSGSFELAGTSAKPFEAKKVDGITHLIQESADGQAYNVFNLKPGDNRILQSMVIPKSDMVAPTRTAAVPPAKKAKPAANKAPAKTVTATPKPSGAYGLDLPPLTGYVPTSIDRSGKAEVDTTTTSQTSGAKPQLVLD